MLVISVILCSHACFKARLPLYFPEKLDNLFSPQQFLLGFCVMLCLSTIKAVNAQICSKHSTYFNSVKESSMNSSLNIPLEGFWFFFFSDSLPVAGLSAEHLKKKEVEPKDTPVLLRYRQIKPMKEICFF